MNALEYGQAFIKGWCIGVGELGLILVHQMTQRIDRLIASGPSNLKFHPLLSTQFQNFNFKYEPNQLLLQRITIIFSTLNIHMIFLLESDIKWPLEIENIHTEDFLLIRTIFVCIADCSVS